MSAPAPPRAVDTTLVRVLALVLIANSHLEALYPRAWMAGDGLAGNALFFLMSGFGLAASAASPAGLASFGRWYWRRLTRIYPAVLLFLAATWPWAVAIRDWPPRVWFAVFIWPTPYNFIAYIVLYYAALWPLLRLGRRGALGAALVLSVVVYVATYAVAAPVEGKVGLGDLPDAFYACLCGAQMLLGAWLGARSTALRPGQRHHLPLFVALFVVYLAARFALARGLIAGAFPIVHWLTLPLAYYALVALGSPRLVSALARSPLLWRGLQTAAGLTLEVYVSHQALATRLEHLPFPLNLALFWILVLPLAWVLAWVVARLRRALSGRPRVPAAAPS